MPLPLVTFLEELAARGVGREASVSSEGGEGTTGRGKNSPPPPPVRAALARRGGCFSLPRGVAFKEPTRRAGLRHPGS